MVSSDFELKSSILSNGKFSNILYFMNGFPDGQSQGEGLITVVTIKDAAGSDTPTGDLKGCP